MFLSLQPSRDFFSADHKDLLDMNSPVWAKISDQIQVSPPTPPASDFLFTKM
jgi:hypothetical protein